MDLYTIQSAPGLEALEVAGLHVDHLECQHGSMHILHTNTLHQGTTVAATAGSVHDLTDHPALQVYNQGC